MKRLMRSAAVAVACSCGPLAAQPCSLPHLGAPERVYTPRPFAAAKTFSGTLTATDLDGDGLSDLAFFDPDGRLVVLFGDGSGGFPRKSTLEIAGTVAGTGDFDGDGRRGLLVQRSGEVQTVTLGADGSQRAGPVTPMSEYGVFGGFSVADVNEDGRSDLVGVSNAGVLVFLSDGQGRFAPPQVVAPRGDAMRAVAADFNGDGHVDIAALAPNRHSGGLLLGDGRTFRATPVSIPGADVTTATVADVNRDGLSDLVIAGGGGLVLWLGDRASGLARGGGTGSPSDALGLAVGDLDGDGNLDFVTRSTDLLLARGDGHGNVAPQERLVAAIGVREFVASPRAGASDLVTMGYDGTVDLRRNACPAVDVLVPVLASTSGVGGTRFETELTLANRGGVPLALSLTFAGWLTGTLTLPPGERTWPGTLALLRDAGIPITDQDVVGSLAIRVTAGSPSDLAAIARVTSAVPGATGRGGVAFPGVPAAQMARTSAWLPWLREDAHDRANVAVVHGGGAADGPMTVRLTVRSADPAHPGVVAMPDVTIAPGEHVQWNRVLALSGLSASQGYARIDRVAGSAPFVAYGIVNDAATGDGSYVPAVRQEDLETQRGALIVPAVVENARYESELSVTNLAGSPRRIEATWHPSGFPPVTVTLDVAPGAQLDIAGFVQYLRELAGDAVPLRGADLAGALELQTVSGDPDGLLAGARTLTTATPERFGVYTPAVATSEAASRAFVFGLRQDGAVRTNLAIANVSPWPGLCNVQIHDAATGAIVVTVRDIPFEPTSWTQLGSLLATIAPSVHGAWVTIDTYTYGGTPTPRFLAYAVVNEGAVPGAGSGDGSYVPMQPW